MAFLDSISFHEDSLELGPLRWNDEKFVTLLEKAKEIKEEDQKKIFLELAESLFVDEVPVIPLYFNVNSYVKKSHVKNVSISDLGQVDFKFTSIE